ncbi:MAG: hypothetical protein HY288_11345 [Planctomycetia bacterium]|nr:hypothetical protein [Planctomycetia bacterium]
MARAGQVISSFAAVVVVYWLYWLIAVPLIEPSVEQEPVARASDDDLRKAREAGRTRTLAVSKYFEEGRWELKEPAIWESDQTQLLFKSIEPQPDGKVRLNPCTVLFFPKNRDETTQPIIMQADEGAVMEFDQPIVLKSVDLGKRQLVGGDLKGPIKIRRKESRPAARDDLAIDTRDITLIKDRLWTPHPVQFRFGRNRGIGREMEILLAAADGSVASAGLRGGTMRTLELKRDVKMQLELGAGPLAAGAASARPNGPEPPIQITCQKSFRFDIERHAASFHDAVDVLRLNTIGPADQLNCDVLTVFFSPHGAKADAAQAAASAGAEGQLSGLQVRVIEARGDPVTLRSPAQGAYVHCHGIDYYPAPAGAAGQMVALGPGVMTGNMPNDPANKYKIQWTRECRFEPAGAQQVASLRGGAKVRFEQMGEIAADEIFAWLSPKQRPQTDRGPVVKTVSVRAASETTTPATANNGWQIERVLAQGNVLIDAPQLSGATAKLEAWIERPHAPVPPPLADLQQAPPPTQPQPAAKERRPQQTYGQRFGVRGGLLRIRFVPEGDQLAVSDVTVEKQARLEEISAPRPGEKPLLVQGDRLHVAEANSDQTRVTVTGKPGYLEAGGMTLRGEAIEMEKHTNRLWIDGPGRMTMPIDQDLNGQPIARPQILNITWQGGMNFQSNTVIYERGVLVKSENQLLRTEKLEAILSRPVDFSTANQPGGGPDERPQLAHIRCYGPAFVESREFDERGQQSRFNQWEGIDLEFDKATGAINARGPGWVTNVSRESDQMGPPRPVQPNKPRAAAPPDKPPADGLKYLNVQYQRSMAGNLNRGEMTFGEPTKTIHGPVPHWEAKLNPEDPASLGQQGLVLDARTLTVRQMPARGREGRAWMELEAIGNVRAENGQFTARGDRLSYSEEKDQIILRGDGRSAAELFQEDETGGERKEFKVAEVWYWLKLQNAWINGVESFGTNFLQAPKKKPAGK